MWHNNLLGFVKKYIGKTSLYFVLLFLIVSNVGVINICFAQQPRTSWHVYRNVRYQYQLCYPDFMVPQGEADNGDGQKFIDRKGAVLRGYSRYLIEDIDPKNLRQFVQKMIKNIIDKQGQITYEVIRKNWAVISGVYQKQTVFYYKYILGPDNQLLALELTYPKLQEKLYQFVIPKMFSCVQYNFDLKIK